MSGQNVDMTNMKKLRGSQYPDAALKAALFEGEERCD